MFLIVMTEHIGYRLERHNAHMAAVCARQRRGQLERVGQAIARLQSWDRAGVLSERERETLGLLLDLHKEIAAEMRAEGQEP